MNNIQRFKKLNILLGDKTVSALAKTTVAIAGLGGVGSWCAEAIARSGIGNIILIDFDKISESNINRQIIALESTIGQYKTDVMAKRIHDINNKCNVKIITEMFEKKETFEKTAEYFCIKTADYVIDAIDSLKNKLDLIETSFYAGKKLFSSMGMAQKTDPFMIKYDSIWKTEGCPLAKLVRLGLKDRGFKGDFTVVYSREKITALNPEKKTLTRENLGSCVTVTASAGLKLASLVIDDIIKNNL